MTYAHPSTEPPRAVDCLHGFLQAFPVSCFTLTILTDLAYVRTQNFLWLHFSEWLLLAGIVFGCLALLVRLVDFLVRKVRPTWPAVLGGVIVLVLAAINSFVHTADGWKAVMPYGLMLSILTVLAMVVTSLLGWRSARHV